MLITSSRKLLNNGISIISLDSASHRLLSEGELPDHIKVEPCEDSDNYELIYGKNISHDVKDDEIIPQIINVSDDDIEKVMNKLSTRRDDNVSYKDHRNRLEIELDFFMKYDKLQFLVTLYNLIEQFKANNVVWGIGRGSSCASYVLFLLEVHDINPIKYDIPFREFSKE